MPDNKDYCLKLTQILSAIAEVNVGQAISSERFANAESLGVKCISHCITAQYLCRGTRLGALRAEFVDPASINVVIRAAVESVLTFYYLFVAGASDEELDFRHDAWILADLLLRQKFTPFSQEGALKLEDEKKQIGRLQEKLRANPVLGTLSVDQKKDVRAAMEVCWLGEIGKDMGSIKSCRDLL